MADKKEIPFALLEILTEYTDEEHRLSAKAIIELLTSQYGLAAERRTIYSNIDLLRKYGYNIDGWEKGKGGYCLLKHQFSPKEVCVLTDLILTSDQLNRREKEQLREKLLKTLSKYQKQKNIM